jgi:hypothetical protein
VKRFVSKGSPKDTTLSPVPAPAVPSWSKRDLAMKFPPMIFLIDTLPHHRDQSVLHQKVCSLSFFEYHFDLFGETYFTCCVAQIFAALNKPDKNLVTPEEVISIRNLYKDADFMRKVESAIVKTQMQYIEAGVAVKALNTHDIVDSIVRCFER